MDGNNWRGGGQVPMVQPLAGTVEQLALSNFGGAPPVDPDEWRAHLPLDSRQRIVNKIMETLKKHLPFSGQEGLQDLKKIAVRFEEKIYSAATSQSDYLRNISLKMLTMETKSQSPMAYSLQPSAANASRNPSDLGKVNASNSSHPNTTTVHLQAPNDAAGSSVLPLSISIGGSEIINVSLSSQPNTHVIHLEAPNPAGSSAKPLAISISITIA